MTAKAVTVTKHEGRVLAWIHQRGEHFWLDLEAEDFLDGVRGLWFIMSGKAPEQTTWVRVDFVPAPIRTYDEVVRKNVDLIMFLRKTATMKSEAA